MCPCRRGNAFKDFFGVFLLLPQPRKLAAALLLLPWGRRILPSSPSFLIGTRRQAIWLSPARAHMQTSRTVSSALQEVRMSHIVLVATGGTIASYAKTEGGAVTAGLSGDRLLESLHAPLPGITVEVDNIEAAGSNALTLETIYKLCRHIDARLAEPGVDGVVVTHGTDTMVDTARYLSGIDGKTIVLTGALTPARFNATDAIFNIGCAVAAVQAQPQGVWVVMNGQIWDPHRVVKNRAANRFEAH